MNNVTKNKYCIYCGKELDGSSEHVLQECLGARWQNEFIMCSECNNLFGNTIDCNLKNVFDIFLNWSGVKSKKGKYTDCIWQSNTNIPVRQSGKNGQFIFYSFKKQPLSHDECIRINCETSDPSKVSNIIKNLSNQPDIKKIEIKNFQTTMESLNGYHKNIDIGVDCYIALRKSMINMWLCTLDKFLLDKSIDLKQYSIERELIKKDALKIRDCAVSYQKDGKKNNSHLIAIFKKAEQYGLMNNFFVVSWQSQSKNFFQQIIEDNKLKLFHSMMVIKESSCLWGLVSLFNHITFLFKLSESSVLPECGNAVFFHTQVLKRFFF